MKVRTGVLHFEGGTHERMAPMRKLALPLLLTAYGCTQSPVDNSAATQKLTAVTDTTQQGPDLGGCLMIDTFDANLGVYAENDTPSITQGYAWDDYLDAVREGQYSDGGGDHLFFFHFAKDQSDAPAVPYAVDLSKSQDEKVGLVFDFLAPTQTENGKRYWATSGSVTVSALDDTTPSGTIAVSGQDVRFDEDDASDTRAPGASCVIVHSFTLSGSYPVQ